MTLKDGTLLISNSEVQTFKQCKRKWYLGYYRELAPITEKMTGALRTGGRVHEALEGYYVPDGMERSDPVQVLRDVQKRDLAVLNHQYDPDAGVAVPTDVEDEILKAFSLELAMITGYMQWIAESGEDAYLKIVAPEQTLEVPFDVRDVTVLVKLIGKLDVRAIRLSDGRRMFIDHKTAADFNRFEQTAGQSEQPLHYMLLEMLDRPYDNPNSLTTVAMYNLLRKVKRTGTAKPPFYKRLPIERNMHEVMGYADKLVYVIQDIWRLTQELNAISPATYAAYPSPGDQCSWKCEFNRLCPLMDDGSRYEMMIVDAFKSHDSLARYDEKGSE